MDEGINITVKLQKLVKQRNTPVVVDEREFGYKSSKSNRSRTSSESYFYSNDE